MTASSRSRDFHVLLQLDSDGVLQESGLCPALAATVIPSEGRDLQSLLADPALTSPLWLDGHEVKWLLRGAEPHPACRSVQVVQMPPDGRKAEGTQVDFRWLPPPFRLLRQELGADGRLAQLWERPHEEQQYLSLVRRVAKRPPEANRCATPVRRIFSPPSHEYDLSRGFPLFTTKRVFFRGVVEELLWILRGSTDAKRLAEHGVHIWDANGTRAFLDQRGLPYEEGELGPVYGHQWRRAGAPYPPQALGEGVDQVDEALRLIREDPHSRRILICAWAPAQLDQMALPPCHVLAQFSVEWEGEGEGQEGRRLSCHMYQRSCDLGLGVPFNVASYALLTCLFAHLTGLKPGRFVHSMGDAHIYENHRAALLQQVDRKPFPWPQLTISPRVKSLDGLLATDFRLRNYQHGPSLHMPLSV